MLQDPIRFLAENEDIPSFASRLQQQGAYPLRAGALEVFQMNVGYLCNLTCKHCHVDAGPTRKEIMPRAVMERCLDVIRVSDVPCVDITGGAPEMNPDLRWFLQELGALQKRIIVRSNLSILDSSKFADYIDLFVENRVEVVASVPDTKQAKLEAQRGHGVYEKIMRVLQTLNRRGYGQPDTGLKLHLVHNPVGAFLPGNQSDLEHEYRRQLLSDWDIVFNDLFCITNIPVGRYLDYLVASDNYDDYMELLSDAYNPAAVANVMCTNTLSIGWDGRIYDCDFNQMLGLPLDPSIAGNVLDLDPANLVGRKIMLHNACYGCTAGAGSSCQGSTT